MPVTLPCKNSDRGRYKETQPSPTGNGWCAHGEEVGKRRLGTDGNWWVVHPLASGSQRWVKAAKAKAKTTKAKTTVVKATDAKKKKTVPIGAKATKTTPVESTPRGEIRPKIVTIECGYTSRLIRVTSSGKVVPRKNIRAAAEEAGVKIVWIDGESFPASDRCMEVHHRSERAPQQS